jgi:hypothetical protein
LNRPGATTGDGKQGTVRPDAQRRGMPVAGAGDLAHGDVRRGDADRAVGGDPGHDATTRGNGDRILTEPLLPRLHVGAWVDVDASIATDRKGAIGVGRYADDLAAAVRFDPLGNGGVRNSAARRRRKRRRRKKRDRNGPQRGATDRQGEKSYTERRDRVKDQ